MMWWILGIYALVAFVMFLDEEYEIGEILLWPLMLAVLLVVTASAIIVGLAGESCRHCGRRQRRGKFCGRCGVRR